MKASCPECYAYMYMRVHIYARTHNISAYLPSLH